MGAVSRVPPIVSISSCLLLATTYVASLYIGNTEHNRDHPSTVKRRFCSVSIVMLLSPAFLYISSSESLFEEVSLLEVIGIRSSGIIQAILLPLILTCVLYTGPITIQILNGNWKTYLDFKYWTESFQNLLWLRNHVVAPLSEEFTFRACMMPLLLQSYSQVKVILITPLFFGVAHCHHIVERFKTGVDFKTNMIIACFQFTYTTIFGFYSSYLFARTGHFVAPFVAHAFCNHMGFPDIQELMRQEPTRRQVLMFLYIFGFVLWIFLLPILTNPTWYDNYRSR